MGTYGNIQHSFEKPTLTSEKTPGIEIVVSKPTAARNQIKKTHNSRGIPTSNAGDSIRGYSDYLLLLDYFTKQKHGLRNHMLFIIGSTTGLRISDLVTLKYRDIFEEDNVTFRKSLNLSEEKTDKNTISLEDEVLITEAARLAITRYLDSRFWQFNRDDWLFWSAKPVATGEMKGQHVITKEYCHKIMKDAQRSLNLPLNLGSHSFRKTFTATLVQVVAHIKPEYEAIIRKILLGMDLAQIALRHDDKRTTLKYEKFTKGMLLEIRNKISDFFLGKTNFKQLVIDYSSFFDDV